MRRTVLLLASAALAMLLASGVAFAEEKLDQEVARPIASPSYHEEFKSDYQHLAQVFTAGKTGSLSKVSVQIEKSACGSGAATDSRYKDINVRIYSLGTTGSLPASTSTPPVIATIPASQVPYQTTCGFWAAPRWTDVTIDPDKRRQVFAGSRYAIALEPEGTASGSGTQVAYHWHQDGDT